MVGMNLIRLWLYKHIFKIQSPSTKILGFDYGYDYHRNKRANKRDAEQLIKELEEIYRENIK